ncbi:hypothetical protein HY025_00255 [Candidatus Daviesbacteria bacterium]|nr:hypothetical protein [Candidatus Daviesbacteria bacterium]
MKILMNYFYPAVLVLICLLLIFINHVPSSYLSGWDTLHPEFNFPLNFQRLIFGVFRDNQGLGAVAAHAHMSDLPRVFFIFFLSSVLPNNLLRFFYIAICLPIGSLGVYFFCKIILLPHSEKKIKEAAAFLAALFYLLNLGTLQHFYVPFEMFNTQYAFLPWLFLTVTNYLKNPSRKNLLFFSLVSLFSTPMAYASTLWYAYFLSLILYLIVFLKKYLRSCLVIIFLTLILNSFWILPNIYFLASGNASNVPNARTNLLFSEEAFAYNKSFGDIKDTLIFKNFLFEWSAYKDNKFEYLLANWRNYLNKPFIAEIGYVMAFISLLGLVYSITKKQQIGVGLIGPTLLSFIFLTNQNPPFDEFFLFLRDHSNLFKEALRFPFTKFSIILMFSFSCYFAYGQKFIFSIFNKIRLKFLIFLVVFITSASLVFYMWPAFRGDLISKLIQVQIPNEYFQMFNWFNNQSLDGRIANLPIHSLWGWTYYDWGFQGSGFLSSGLKQPLLDRDFDRWNPSNEEYYREMSYAIYSTNINLVEKVLSKYQIKYIILDDNVIAPGINVGRGILFTNQIKSLFDQSTKIRLVKKFGNIEIYQADLDKSYQGFFYSPVNLTSISGNFGFKDLDYEYLQSGDYINNLNNPSIKNLVFKR